MKLEYYNIATRNFGDDLNFWLWHKLIPDLLAQEDDNYLLGIGTIFNDCYNDKLKTHKKVVFSSGAGYGSETQINGDTWDIIGVRGKKTADVYGLSPDKILCDGAYLLRSVVKLSDFSQGEKIGFMPHHASIDFFDWETECEKLGLHYISPQLTVDDVLENMKMCNRLITEAMHGAIVADALRIPWCAVSYSPYFLKFKWEDWTSVLDIDAVIHELPFFVSNSKAKKRLFTKQIKYFFAQFGVGKAKWRKIPNISISKDKAGLIKTLSDLKNSTSFQLSSNETVLSLDEKLNSSLIHLKNKYLLK